MKKVIRRYKSDLKDWWQKVLDDVAWAEYDFEGQPIITILTIACFPYCFPYSCSLNIISIISENSVIQFQKTVKKGLIQFTSQVPM